MDTLIIRTYLERAAEAFLEEGSMGGQMRYDGIHRKDQNTQQKGRRIKD